MRPHFGHFTIHWSRSSFPVLIPPPSVGPDGDRPRAKNLAILSKHGLHAEISPHARRGNRAPSAPRDRSCGGRPLRCSLRAEPPVETARPRPRVGTRASERVRARTVPATSHLRPPGLPPSAASRTHRATRGTRGPENRTRERRSVGPSLASGLAPG